jgi:hypothetical protein
LVRAVDLAAAALALAVQATVGCAQPGEAKLSVERPDVSPKKKPPMSPAARFPDLDAYLAYLEKRSHMGGAWYREVAPGRFQLQTPGLRPSQGALKTQVFTRKELEQKFGFSK